MSQGTHSHLASQDNVSSKRPRVLDISAHEKMKTPLILFSFSSASLAGDSRRRTRISTSSKSIKRSPDRLKSWTSTDLKNEDPCLYFSMLSQPQSGAVRSHVHEQHAVRQLVLKLSKLKSHESDAGVANSTQVSFMCRYP